MQETILKRVFEFERRLVHIKQLDILEKQIAIEITKAELKQVTELNNFINK